MGRSDDCRIRQASQAFRQIGGYNCDKRGIWDVKKLNQITNITIGSFVGVFIGCGIYVFWDYKKHPDLYAMQSAPWYTSIFIYGIVMLIFAPNDRGTVVSE